MADFITELRDRRILPAVGVYVAGVWVAIEILDRLVERYLLSPYLTDIVFWGLYSLIPAVMLIAWTHGRPGKDKATRLEKVGVPINLIATMGLLITVFGDKDFDLAATQITVNNELGQQETHYIPSETFRRRMAVFFWKNESGNPNWTGCNTVSPNCWCRICNRTPLSWHIHPGTTLAMAFIRECGEAALMMV